MPELLGATNPVPGYERNVENRSAPVSPGSLQVQNAQKPGQVGRADGRTERQDNGSQGDSGRIRYDSNFQTFLQRLRESPDLSQALHRLFTSSEGMVVLSGMSEGMAAEMSKALQMLRMDERQLLEFLKGQFKAGTRFGGALFALLRGAYARAASDGVRNDILQFLKIYADHSSAGHVEGNLLRNLQGMADAMPASWAERLRMLLAQLKNGIDAGDRQGNLALLRRELFPYMSDYVDQTHDIGTARGLLTLMSLDVARYENGLEENLLQAFRQLCGYPTLKQQLGGIDDQSLLALLRNNQIDQNGKAAQFANYLAAAAARALRGEGSAEVQEAFRQLVGAMLVNQSVYMPVNHYLVPLEQDGRLLFSELWVDPDAEEGQKKSGEGGRSAMKLLLKMDVQSLGLFDVVLTSKEQQVSVMIACPQQVSPFAKEIETAIGQILSRNGLTPGEISVRRMEQPLALTEVFPKIFEGKNSVNVKV